MLAVSTGARRVLMAALALWTMMAPAPLVAASNPDSLLRLATGYRDDPDPGMRRHGLEILAEATRLAPERADLWLALGRYQLQIGERGAARASFQRAASRPTPSAEAHLELGIAYKWDWLESLEPESFRQSAEALARATAEAPDRADAWLELTALALVRGDARLAAEAAVYAQNADPSNAMAVVALACAAYRLGRLHVADSLFDDARARLSPELAARFDDLKLIEPRTGSRDSAGGHAEAERFWADNDPDLTTPENELKLGHAARVGHALLLFSDHGASKWDMRTELVVRYGLPAKIEYNRPRGSLQSYKLATTPESTGEGGGSAWRGPETWFGYPYNEQVWSYPSIGLKAVIWDRALDGRYVTPVHEKLATDPMPDPQAVAALGDMIAMGNGRALYRALAPGLHSRVALAHFTRFPAEGGARVLIHVSTPGAPSDTLSGQWVVLDSKRREVLKNGGALSVSACDPTGMRAADFIADLKPGDYRLGFSVVDVHGGRGIATVPVQVEPRAPGIAMSDLALLCGDAATSVADQSVRIEPDMDSRIASGRSLSVYFEIVGLALGADGQARFSFTYRVRAIGEMDLRAGVAPPALEASREETQPGSLRRQFLQVPVQKLAAGDYELEVEVRDMLAGTSARSAARFTIEAQAGGKGSGR